MDHIEKVEKLVFDIAQKEFMINRQLEKLILKYKKSGENEIVNNLQLYQKTVVIRMINSIMLNGDF